jgi:RNA polymerase sigma-70 factor (ECF subfamily)
MSDTEIARNMFIFSEAAATAAAPVAASEASPDVRLVERVCAGDPEAFGELYKRFAPVVHGIVLLRVPYGEAQDIVQEVFLSVFENIHGLRDHRAFPGWLARIARNRAAEFHRRKRPSEEIPEELEGARGTTAEAAEILDAIRSLPRAYREPLVLRLVEGMTGVEIAERTGLTHESVRVHLHRGMSQLRQKLGISEKRK